MRRRVIQSFDTDEGIVSDISIIKTHHTKRCPILCLFNHFYTPVKKNPIVFPPLTPRLNSLPKESGEDVLKGLSETSTLAAMMHLLSGNLSYTKMVCHPECTPRLVLLFIFLSCRVPSVGP